MTGVRQVKAKRPPTSSRYMAVWKMLGARPPSTCWRAKCRPTASMRRWTSFACWRPTPKTSISSAIRAVCPISWARPICSSDSRRERRPTRLLSGRSPLNRMTVATSVIAAAAASSMNAEPTSTISVSALVTRPVSDSITNEACPVWLVRSSCSSPSLSRDCTAQDALAKAATRPRRSERWMSAARLAGSTTIGS